MQEGFWRKKQEGKRGRNRRMQNDEYSGRRGRKDREEMKKWGKVDGEIQTDTERKEIRAEEWKGKKIKV